MNLGEKEVAILIAMHKAVAITEQNAMTFKEIAESCDVEINSGRLVDMRTKSLLRSTGGSLNKWWLTPAGVERAELEMMHTELKAPECPASVGGDIDLDQAEVKISHCKTIQLAAALEQATHEIIALKDELALLKSTQPNSTPVAVGYLLGDVPKFDCQIQLYSEDDKLIAYTDIEQAKKDGETACAESAYNFAVYALVPVGAFKSRVVVDWVSSTGK